MKTRFALAAVISVFVLGAFPWLAPAQEPVSFRKDIAPILVDNCLACHGPKKAEGGYRIDTYERLVGEGDSGAPGFVAKDVDSSEAFRRIVSDDPAERMPLDGDPLPEETVTLLRRWIDEGVNYDGGDAAASLTSIIPPAVYPGGPEVYPFAIPVTAVAFSADGQQLFSSGYHQLNVWNPADGSLLRRIDNVSQRVLGIAVSPDNQRLAVAGGTPGKLGETRLYDLASGELKSVLGLSSDVALDVVFSPQGDRLAVAGADNIIRIFEVATGKEQLTITSHSDWVMAVAWNADGSKLASGSRDKTSKVFDGASGELLVTYSGHGQPVKGVAFHPEGNDVFSSGADNKIHRWTIAEAKKTAEVAFGGEVFKLVRAGDFLFATSADKTARQFTAADQNQVRSFAGHVDWALSIAYHGGTQRVAAGGFDGQVHIWNAESGEAVATFYAAPGFTGK
jgi:dipeptidyl aminopeptidase/acylaminoacyl peptidase